MSAAPSRMIRVKNFSELVNAVRGGVTLGVEAVLSRNTIRRNPGDANVEHEQRGAFRDRDHGKNR